MQQFTDGTGQVWTLKADVTSLKRIRDLTDKPKLDFTHLLDDQDVIAQATSSAEVFVDMLFIWLQPQADELKVTAEQFGIRVYDCFDQAFEAVLAELPNFSPPHRRTLVKGVIDKFLAAEQMGTQRVQEVLDSDQMDETIRMAMDKAEADAMNHARAQIGGKKSTSSPAS